MERVRPALRARRQPVLSKLAGACARLRDQAPLESCEMVVGRSHAETSRNQIVTELQPNLTAASGRGGGRPSPAEVGLHELVEVTVENGVDIAGLVLGAVVLDQLEGRQHVVAE